MHEAQRVAILKVMGNVDLQVVRLSRLIRENLEDGRQTPLTQQLDNIRVGLSMAYADLDEVTE